MARLLPLRSDATQSDAGARVLDLEDEEADAVFSALSSDTARRIYRTLHDEPTTPSEIADACDTSIQNVRYHLGNLEEAGLVEVIDTWYSSRGNEMSVYAPASEALVFASDEQEASRLRSALTRLLGGVGVLGLASLAVQRIAKTYFVGGRGPTVTGGETDVDKGAGGYQNATGGTSLEHGATGTPTATDGGVSIADAETTARETAQQTTQPPQVTNTAEPQATHTAAPTQAPTHEPATTQAAVESTVEYAKGSGDAVATTHHTTVAEAARNGGIEAASTLEPGLLFFLGGLLVLLLVVGYWYWAEP